MTAKFISLLKPNKENALSIGRTVLESVKITDDRSIIDTLLALSYVARALNETLNTIRKDLGDNFGNQIFMDDNWYLNNVWHDTSEKPEECKELFIYKERDCGSSFYTALYSSHSDTVYINGRWYKLSTMTRWAYIEDLIADNMSV